MKSNRIIPLVLLAFLLGAQEVHAQQQPLYSQYSVDKFLVNPAIAGANGLTSINLISRQQYIGFVNPPQTFALNVQSRLLDDSYILKKMRLKKDSKRKSRSGRVGLGGSVFTDRNGIIHRTGIQGTYAYHVNINNEWQLSGGLSMLAFQYRVDDEGEYVLDPNDPLAMSPDKTFLVFPDVSAGLLITNGGLYAGLSMNDIFGSSLQLGEDQFGDYRTLRKYSLIAGYKFGINSLLSLEPSVLLQGTSTNIAFDFNTRLYYMDNYWAGLSYRSNKSMVVMLGGRYEMFYLGYAYDLNMGLVQTYTSGSHELIIGVRIGDNSTRRIRWFKQDERNYDI